jgi:hypothetical protein
MDADISAAGAMDDAMRTGNRESPSSSRSSDMSSGTQPDDESRLIEAIRKTALPVQPPVQFRACAISRHRKPRLLRETTTSELQENVNGWGLR